MQVMLSAFVNEHRNDWDDHLPYVLCAYRSTIQESTGCTPNLMMFGREIHLPLDVMVGLPKEKQPCPVLYVEWVRNVLENTYQFAQEQLHKAAQRQKRNYDTKYGPKKFEAGIWVWYWYPPKARGKLNHGWDGPYMVIKVISEVLVQIQKSKHHRSRIVHIDTCVLVDDEPGNLPHNWLSDDSISTDTEVGQTNQGVWDCQLPCFNTRTNPKNDNEELSVSDIREPVCLKDEKVTRSGRVVRKPNRLDL